MRLVLRHNRMLALKLLILCLHEHAHRVLQFYPVLLQQARMLECSCNRISSINVLCAGVHTAKESTSRNRTLCNNAVARCINIHYVSNGPRRIQRYCRR